MQFGQLMAIAASLFFAAHLQAQLVGEIRKVKKMSRREPG